MLFLNLETGALDQRSQMGHERHPDASGLLVSSHSADAREQPGDLLAVAARSRRRAQWSEGESRTAPSRLHEPSAKHRIVDPVVRGETTIALIDIESRRPINVERLNVQCGLIRGILSYIYERRFTLRLLHELQQPIDVNQTRAEFFDALAALIRASTGMEFVAIREYDREPDALRCVAAVGLAVQRGEFHELDWPRLDDYPSFRQALGGATVVEPTTLASHLKSIRRSPHLKDVRSFVALPILASGETIGVLSVAARCPYTYSRVEARGFETVANSIGVAMANYRNLHASTENVRRLAETGAGALSDLLAQASRHEAKRRIDNVQKQLLLTEEGLELKSPSSAKLIAGVKSASEELKETVEALDKMRTNALIRPNQNPVRANLRELVINSTNQVSGQLDAEEISVSYPPATYVQVIPEALTIAFLLLIENSAYAFKKARKRGRAIEVGVGARQAGAETVRVTIADNATGIDPNRLTIPPEHRSKPWEQAIFETGVTGSNGTGYGLYLVRTLIKLAGGGAPTAITLLEYRNRVVFGVDLPVAD